MTQKEFAAISSSIPTQPGIYKYFNADNLLLYVGKAKHLKKRVSSYFTNSFTTSLKLLPVLIYRNLFAALTETLAEKILL